MKATTPGGGGAQDPALKFLETFLKNFLKSRIIVDALANNATKFYVVLVVHHFEKKILCKIKKKIE